jgi:hypothetical protein
LVRKRLQILGRKTRWSPGDLAATAQFIKQIPHGKPLADIRLRVQFAAGIEGLSAVSDDLSGQRDIGRDDQIARLRKFYDTTIGNVQPSGHHDAVDIFGAWNAQRLIGDQRHLGSGSFGGPIQHLFDLAGAGVGVDPDLHGFPPSSTS